MSTGSLETTPNPSVNKRDYQCRKSPGLSRNRLYRLAKESQGGRV